MLATHSSGAPVATATAPDGELDLRAVFEGMAEMAVLHELIVDEQGRAIDYRLLDCNQAFVRGTGIAREAAVGARASVLYGTGAPPYLEIYARVATTGQPTHFESYFAPMDKLFSISVTSPRRGVFATITHDITALSHALRDLQLEEERLRTLNALSLRNFASEAELVDYALEEAVRITGSEVGYFHQVEDGGRTMHLIAWSKEARARCTAGGERHLPLAAAGLWADSVRLGRPVFHNDYLNHPQRRELPKGHFAITRHLSCPVFDGEKIVAVVGVGNKVAPYDEKDARELHLFFDHVWRRVLQQREQHDRLRLERQLRASQKLEAIGSLAGGIAHDFNNILSVILTCSGFAMKGLRKDDPLFEDLDEIRGAGLRAAGLTRQLLAFSRKQALAPVVLNVVDVVADMERMLKRLIGEHISLELSLPEEAATVKADPAQLEQVLLNLVVNARDAMPDGGRLTVEVEEVQVTEATALPGLAPPGRYVRISLTDTGTGMDEATQQRIFEPFFTTKAQGKGTGLGLSTVYGIVKQSGGHISLQSQPGQGTSFQVLLPWASEEPSTQAIAPAPVASAGPCTETLLVLEDEDAIRKVVARHLRSMGYQVLAAANGGEALLTCEQHRGPIHLLLTDVVMPQMNGRQVAERLQKERPDLKVLYMSGHTDDAISTHGVLAPEIRLLHKPFSAAELAEQVRAMLDASPARDVKKNAGAAL